MSNTFRPSAPIKHTVIEEGSEFKGSLTSSCPIDVRGRIEGDLATPALTVSASGSVHGKAKVGAVRSEGELSGEFDADTVELAGSVRDNTVIRARSLEVKLASERGKLQVIFGETELSIGDEPTEHDRVDTPVRVSQQPPAAPLVEAPPVATSVGEAFAVVADLPAVHAVDPSAAADDGDDGDDAAQASDGAGDEPAGKRRKKRKDMQPGENNAEVGWTQPPSQPPPAN
jgi:cytoskeletal protein CcmA (bactofilin family)